MSADVFQFDLSIARDPQEDLAVTRVGETIDLSIERDEQFDAAVHRVLMIDSEL